MNNFKNTVLLIFTALVLIANGETLKITENTEVTVQYTVEERVENEHYLALA